VKGLAAALAVISWAASAHATYSIVAADLRSNTTGGAGTSCVSGADVFIINTIVPGVGTLHAQATFNQDARDTGYALLAAGKTPGQIIEALISPDFDPGYEYRQYGVVDLSGAGANFTGAMNGAFAGARRALLDNGIVYSVQGNLLTSENVLDNAAAAFEAAGCDLPERLMRALEAGAENGEGDHRCTDSRGIPSDSAFIRVATGSGADAVFTELRVPTSGDENPLVELRAELEAWRADHPCSEPAAGANDAASDPRLHPPHPGPNGCECDLPRGRTSGAGGAGAAGVAILLGFRRRRRRQAGAF
jgi:uncharacterized Ntn-hydrolase superfamily protein